jgi:hypothetical protein
VEPTEQNPHIEMEEEHLTNPLRERDEPMFTEAKTEPLSPILK